LGNGDPPSPPARGYLARREYTPGAVDGRREYTPGAVAGRREYTPGAVDGRREYTPGAVDGRREYTPGAVDGRLEYTPGAVDGGANVFSREGREPCSPEGVPSGGRNNLALLLRPPGGTFRFRAW